MLVKCSLHNHTTMSDGALSPGQLLHELARRGFKVIAITDHNCWTLPHELQMPEDIIFLNGVEWTFRWHIIKLELPLEPGNRAFDWRDRIDLARIDWLAHPARYGLSVEKIREIVRAYKLDGVEKCNRNQIQYQGHIDDMIEVGVDDCHDISMIGKNWIEIEVDSFDKETVIEKIKSGDFVIKSR